MSRTIGIILLTTAAGGAAAFGLANFLIYWLQIPQPRGRVGLLRCLRHHRWRDRRIPRRAGHGAVGALRILENARLRAGDCAGADGGRRHSAHCARDPGPTLDGDKLVVEVEFEMSARVGAGQ